MPSETTSINIGLKKIACSIIVLMNYISYKPLLFAYNLHKILISNLQLVMLRCTTYVRYVMQKEDLEGVVFEV